MAKNYVNWIKVLKEYKASIGKDLAEIRRCQAEMQRIKTEILSQYGDGLYVRDDKSIIISAPEIIIGNLNRDGTLIQTDASSKVIIRSNNIRNEAASNLSHGTITNMADQISNVCADPGIDGNEANVNMSSNFSVQAQSVVLQSEETMGTFIGYEPANKGEIKIMADKSVTVAAEQPMRARLKQTDDLIKNKTDEKKRLEDSVLPNVEILGGRFKSYDAVKEMGQEEVQLGNHDMYKRMCNEQLHSILKDVSIYQDTVSKISSLDKQIKALTAKQKYILDNINNPRALRPTAINLQAGTTSILSKDEDQNLHLHKGAGFEVNAKNITLHSMESLKKGIASNSHITLGSENIQMSTNNYGKGSNPGSLNMSSQGKVSITSRDIVLQSVSLEKKDEKAKITERFLDDEGSIKIHSCKVDINTNRTDGEVVGNVRINSRHIGLVASNINPKTGEYTPSVLGDIYMNAKRINQTYTGDDLADTSYFSIGFNKVYIKAQKKAEFTQGKNKAMIQMIDGKTYWKGSQNEITGKLDVVGEATFKSPVSLTDASVKNLEIKTYVKTPHSLEGNKISAGNAPDPNRKEIYNWEDENKKREDKLKEDRKKEAEEVKKRNEEEKKKIEQVEKEEQEGRDKMKKRLKDNEKKEEELRKDSLVHINALGKNK